MSQRRKGDAHTRMAMPAGAVGGAPGAASIGREMLSQLPAAVPHYLTRQPLRRQQLVLGASGTRTSCAQSHAARRLSTQVLTWQAKPATRA